MLKIKISIIATQRFYSTISLFLKNIGKYWPEDLNAISEFGPFRISKKGFIEGANFNIIDLCCHKETQNEVYL